MGCFHTLIIITQLAQISALNYCAKNECRPQPCDLTAIVKYEKEFFFFSLVKFIEQAVESRGHLFDLTYIEMEFLEWSSTVHCCACFHIITFDPFLKVTLIQISIP